MDFPFNPADKNSRMVDYLDQSAFDEKFEINPKNDSIRNIHHIKNKYFVPILSGSCRELIAYSKDHLIHPDDSKIYATLMDVDTLEERLKNSDMPGMLKAAFREKLIDGTYRWVQYIAIAGAENGVPDGIIYFYVFDIQNQKDRLEGNSSFAHSNDIRNPVTGLRLGESFLSLTIDLAGSKPGSWCYVAIDIQHFKVFNSWFGYEKGDYLLCQIGSYLADIEKDGDAVAAYFGRDTFALMIRHDPAKIRKIYNDIHEIINTYSKMIGFLPAFGICILEEGTLPGLDTYDRARAAVENAKKSYSDRICYFDFRQYKKTRESYELLTDFQNALASGEITFYVQPQCRISTGKIVGAEALVRWIRQDGRIVSPGTFVPFLESSGFITELDKCVWDGVCRWLRSLIDRNITPVPVSVNVSQVDLHAMDVAAYLYALTERFNIPPRLLKIEITETAYAENFDIITQTIEELKKRGFSVFMDDFGAGYSSLNMLDKINADVLKLDMLFLRKKNALSKKGISIVESVLSMTKMLEMPVIVEGIETDEEAAFLRNLGCRYAQGYYFYKPMPIADYEALLQDPLNIDSDGYKIHPSDMFHAKEFLNEHMFTVSMLNHILGPVAYYELEGEDLTISRFNEAFYRTIGDAQMDSRKIAIQNYVVENDRPMIYRALREAETHIADGGSCEARFYKSDSSVFWFHMKFFYLKTDGNKKLFYGQVEDITENREQSIRFFEVLHEQADTTMCIDLSANTIQYITGENTLYQIDLPSSDLDTSVRQTAQNRITDPADRQAFIDFFNPKRLKDTYKRAIYHEVLNINFKLDNVVEAVEFSTYYIRHSKDQNLTVYAFAKRSEHELLEKDPLTGMRNRYAYNEMLHLYESQIHEGEGLVVFSMDINGLKTVNDTFGHTAGDELIRAAAECITQVISPYGTCFRLGGDEFAAFIYGSKVLAQALNHELEQTLTAWSGQMIQAPSLSCGFASADEYPEAGIADLVKLADMRMYRAKSLYYQHLGIDRRMQQAAFNALCNSYAKILKVNLTEDRFEIIRADKRELLPEKGYSESISGWLQKFGMSDLIDDADRERYLQQTDIEHLRRFFRSGNDQFSLHYRRKINNKFSMAMMEIIRTPEYRDDDQKVFLYVKNIGE